MAAEVPNDDTLFMYDGGFILRLDLEFLYAMGDVTPNDTVRVFENNKKSYAMKISALILLYGAEFPFRMIPKDSGDSESPEIEKSENVTLPGPSETIQPIILSKHETIIAKRENKASKMLESKELRITEPTQESSNKIRKIRIYFPGLPRAPLLDPMPPNEELVSTEKFNEVLDECAEMFKMNKKRFAGSRFLEWQWNCTYCNTVLIPETSNVLNAFLHIKGKQHRMKMEYKATESDLMFWKNWSEMHSLSRAEKKLKRIEEAARKTTNSENPEAGGTEKDLAPKPVAPLIPVSPVPPVTPDNTVPAAVRATPSSAPIRITCTLPLFGRRSPIQSRLNEWEPTNEQISYVNREWRMRPGATSFFNNCTYCSLCKEDMSFWTLLEVVRHAFSVNHLKRYGRPKNISKVSVTSENGCQFWIEKLQHLCFEVSTTVPSIPCVSRLGLRYGPTNYNDGFTANQKEIIANVDMDKLNACALLLENFGGCIYCNKWLLTGKEVFEHWMNDLHMTKIRQQHEVARSSMYDFMTYLKSCQKE